MRNNPDQTMGTSTHDRIVIRGYDLATQLMGEHTFTEAFFLSVTGELPSKSELELVDLVLVTLMDHGMTANSIAARLTYHAAPDAVQGAMAAGLLGAGNRLLGALEGTARVLQEASAVPESEQYEWMVARVERMRAAGDRVPGLGHFVHTETDPRVAILKSECENRGYATAYWSLLETLKSATNCVYDREFVINADGAIGALLSELGFNWKICRGFAVVARAAGLLGHINDEVRNPVSWAMWDAVEAAVPYNDPMNQGADTGPEKDEVS